MKRRSLRSYKRKQRTNGSFDYHTNFYSVPIARKKTKSRSQRTTRTKKASSKKPKTIIEIKDNDESEKETKKKKCSVTESDSDSLDDYQYWVKQHKKVQKKSEANESPKRNGYASSTTSKKTSKCVDSDLTNDQLDEKLIKDSSNQKNLSSPSAGINPDSNSNSLSSTNLAGSFDQKVSDLKACKIPPRKPYLAQSQSDTDSDLKRAQRKSLNMNVNPLSSRNIYSFSKTVHDSDSASVSDSDSDFIRNLAAKRKSQPSDSDERSSTKSDLSSSIEPDSNSDSDMSNRTYQNPEFILIYQSLVSLKSNFPLSEHSLDNERTKNFYCQQIEKVTNCMKKLDRTKTFRKNIGQKMDTLPSIFSLLLIGDIVGEAMKFYAGKCENIIKLGLDFLCELSILARTNMIKEGTRRGRLEKYDKYALSEDELNYDIGYSFGLAMVATQSENIYDDVQKAYFQFMSSNRDKKLAASAACSRNQNEHLSRACKRVKRTIIEKEESSKDAALNYSSNFFQGIRPRHEVCIMCREVNDFNIEYCIGCSGCFHIIGPCYDQWYKGPRMKFSGIGKFLCPSCRVGQALVKASYENDLHLIYDLLVVQAASPFHKYVVEGNKPYFPIENVTSLHISLTQNNYNLTSMLLSGAYELLHCTSCNPSSDFEPPASFPEVCWGRDGCQLGHQKPCWREYACQELQLCNLNPFDRAFHQSTMTLFGPSPIESMLLMSFRGGGSIEKVRSITKIRLSKKFGNTNLASDDDNIVLPQNDVSMGAERVPIPWINETDDGEKLDTDFVYVNQAIESMDARISWFQCRNQKPKSRKSAKNQLASWKNQKIDSSFSSGILYTPRGSLQLLDGTTTKCDSSKMNKALQQMQQIGLPRVQFECNYLCPCRSTKRSIPVHAGRREVVDCGNRQISSGIKHKLQIFRTEFKGWGVRTLETIKKGEVVCGYAGLYQMEKNVKEWANQDEFTNSYVMNLAQNERMSKSSVVINGNEFRSFSGFINHECSNANLDLFHWHGNHLDTCFPAVGFKAKNNISPLTELCFNYGEKIFAECPLCKEEHCLCDHCMDWKHDLHHKKKNGLR